MDDIIRSVESSLIRDDYPEFGSGDTVKIHFQVKEGEKTRVQIFQGVVISRRGGGTSETFNLRAGFHRRTLQLMPKMRT